MPVADTLDGLVILGRLSTVELAAQELQIVQQAG
jgi:hypothetical protein